MAAPIVSYSFDSNLDWHPLCSLYIYTEYIISSTPVYFDVSLFCSCNYGDCVVFENSVMGGKDDRLS